MTGLIIAFLLGLAMGCIFTKLLSHPETVGALRVDSSDPDDGPYLFLELTSNPEVIKTKKYIYLKVDTRSYITQK